MFFSINTIRVIDDASKRDILKKTIVVNNKYLESSMYQVVEKCQKPIWKGVTYLSNCGIMSQVNYD